MRGRWPPPWRRSSPGTPGAVADYRGGREQALGFLLSQVMRKTKGKADPQLARQVLLERLKDPL